MSRPLLQVPCSTRCVLTFNSPLASTTDDVQIGYTVMIVLIEIIIADITSLRSRLISSYVPAIPFLVSNLQPMSPRLLTVFRSTLGSAAMSVKQY